MFIAENERNMQKLAKEFNAVSQRGKLQVNTKKYVRWWFLEEKVRCNCIWKSKYNERICEMEEVAWGQVEWINNGR